MTCPIRITHWLADSTYTSQVNYNFQTPCLLETYPPMGPNTMLQQGDSLESVRSYELLMDSYDRERRGLAIRKMYRTIAPWTDRNPIFMHLVSHDDAQVYTAIDQCANTGYEALILSFGSNCDMDDTSAANIARWKTLADYAHKMGILIGAYSLFSSRHIIGDTDDVIGPKNGQAGGVAFFGYAPCYGSRYWGLPYLAKIKHFLSAKIRASTYLKTTGLMPEMFALPLRIRGTKVSRTASGSKCSCKESSCTIGATTTGIYGRTPPIGISWTARTRSPSDTGK